MKKLLAVVLSASFMMLAGAAFADHPVATGGDRDLHCVKDGKNVSCKASEGPSCPCVIRQ